MTTILPALNEAWGFFGTARTFGADPARAWNTASAMIAAETDVTPEAVRAFLDSRHGRHFADDVANELAATNDGMLEPAIRAAIARWEGWRIGRALERELGIPRGLPYLTGFLGHFAILAEADA